MTGREKIEAAFTPDGTPEIPAVIPYEGIFIRDHWEQLTAQPWWIEHSPDLAARAAAQCDVMRAIDQDWFAVGPCGSRADRAAVRVEARRDGVYRRDASGAEARMGPPPPGGRMIAPPRPQNVPETAKDLDERIGEPGEFDGAAFSAAGHCDLADLLIERLGGQRLPMGYTASPLWRCWGLWGFEGFMTRVADSPELVAYATKRLLTQAVRNVRAAAAVGARAVWIEECCTDMIGPEAFAKLNLPVLRPLIDEIRSLGMRSIYYYCGSPAGKWDLILSTGADAIALEEGKKGFDIGIADVVRRADGRCAVLGNLDAIGALQNGDESQLRAAIECQLDAARAVGGRFIMSLGSPVTPATPVERVRLYCDMVHDLGRL